MMTRNRQSEDGGVGAVLVGSSYTALGVVRSLGRHGIPVWVLGPRSSLPAVSRYASRVIPVGGLDEAAQADLLVHLAESQGTRGWVLFPEGDRAAAMMARNLDRLSQHYACTVPPWDVIRWAVDKHLAYELAEDLHIDYPKTYYPTSEADVERLDGTFPMIVKPLNHEGTDEFSKISGAWRADDRKELLDVYRRASESLSGRQLIVVQEMVPGIRGHYCYTALCDEGRVLADLSAERMRLVPVDFGSSAAVVTIDRIPEVESAARRWLTRARYTGLVELEFKRHERTGRYILLDVNARPWMWHPLGAYAGVDFPYLMWRFAQGKTVSAGQAKAGERWVRTVYDLSSATQLVLRHELTWKAYAESIRGAHHEMGQLDDMMPVVAEFPRLVQGAWRKLAKS